MQAKPKIRIGYGVDVHQLAEGYPLWIGGIELPSPLGAVGHSDADVLIHAICDALLGALALRDIGYHFSDQDPQYKGIDSKILLKRVFELIQQQSYGIINIDADGGGINIRNSSDGSTATYWDLAGYGMATLIKVGENYWYISGNVSED